MLCGLAIAVFGYFIWHQKYTIHTVTIMPLGKVDSKSISAAKKCVEEFYHCSVNVAPAATATDDLLAASKTRLEAGKILDKYDNGSNLLILTEQDIAYKNTNRGIAEWGIFGLGKRPGKICVVSTFRLAKNATKEKMLVRIQKVCIHEVGHNLGLPHCTSDNKCLMNDANGTIKQVDEDQFFFCEDCKRKLKIKGITIGYL